ncbi:hypothetical protein BC830DRAFT_115860 [Chytriomyces sp. MP71]|nr:hypothetical protein BC830DRAFT_115860 [Chytriomyces sp. MP71]
MSSARPPLHILYASETGTAIDCAQALARDARRMHFTVERIAAMDSALDALTAEDGAVLLFCVAVTGQGAECRNMVRFWRFLMRRDTPKNVLEGTRFAVFGLGDSSYAKFNYPAKKLFKRLVQLGASPLVPRGDGDDQHPLGVDGAFDPWCESLWTTLLDRCPLPGHLHVLPKNVLHPASYTLAFLAASPAEPAPPPAPLPRATCIQNTRITAQSHFQDVRHISFQLPSQTRYSPADVMTIHPRNPPDEVSSLLEFLEWTDIADRPFQLHPALPNVTVPSHWSTILTLRTVLEKYLDFMGRPKRYFFHLLAFFAVDVMHAEKLREFASAEGQELYAYCHKLRRTTFEVLTDFHSCRGKIPPAYLFDLIPPMRPRMYSISSAQSVSPGQLDLTVGLVKYKTRMQKMREGVCSRFLERLEVRDFVDFTIDKGTLKLPSDTSVPVILIGAGTGIAPMRSLLLDRIHQGATRNLLFCGFRGAQSDYLHGDDFERIVRQGSLQVFPAFSRDHDEGKVSYVQHRMKEQARLVWETLQEGGCIYVSGNAQRIPRAVNDALLDIFKQEGGLGVEEAHAFLVQLEKERRYQSECWT